MASISSDLRQSQRLQPNMQVTVPDLYMEVALSIGLLCVHHFHLTCSSFVRSLPAFVAVLEQLAANYPWQHLG